MRDQSKRFKITFCILAAACIILGFLAHFYTRFPGDLQVSRLLQSFENQPFLATMEAVSYTIGNWRGVVVVGVASLIVWRLNGKVEAIMILLSGLFTGVNELFKLIVNRPRPANDLVQVFVIETEKSFPSGHAFFTVAVLGFICYLIAVRQSKKLLRFLIVAVWLAFTLIIGFSRIYLGVHWLSDVIGGYMVGTAFLVLEIWLYSKFRQLRETDEAKISKIY